LRYRALAAQYDASCKYTSWERAAAIEVLQIADGDVVFDVACGIGATLGSLAEKVGPRARPCLWLPLQYRDGSLLQPDGFQGQLPVKSRDEGFRLWP